LGRIGRNGAKKKIGKKEQLKVVHEKKKLNQNFKPGQQKRAPAVEKRQMPDGGGGKGEICGGIKSIPRPFDVQNGEKGGTELRPGVAGLSLDEK